MAFKIVDMEHARWVLTFANGELASVKKISKERVERAKQMKALAEQYIKEHTKGK